LDACGLRRTAGSPGRATSRAGRTRGATEANRDLAGAIDIHVHQAPDSEPWRMDAIEIAKAARARPRPSRFHFDIA